MKEDLIANDYVVAHSIHHSRKVAAPDYFKDVDPTTIEMKKHKLVQLHEPSGRMNLYIAAHGHHIDGIPKHNSDEIFKKLMEHATQEKYTFSVRWENEGDLIVWDNTSVMHRSGRFDGGYVRDMRRTTVHDSSSTAWGLNQKGEKKFGFNVADMSAKEAIVGKQAITL